MFLIRICGWHWSGSGAQALLPGFGLTHGICPLCYDLMKDDLPVKPKAPEWVQLFKDGGWSKIPSVGWCPRFTRERNHLIHLIEPIVLPSDAPYRLTIDGRLIYEGDLTECLFAAGGYDI
jgi:hypothetical protein